MMTGIINNNDDATENNKDSDNYSGDIDSTDIIIVIKSSW